MKTRNFLYLAFVMPNYLSFALFSVRLGLLLSEACCLIKVLIVYRIIMNCTEWNHYSVISLMQEARFQDSYAQKLLVKMLRRWSPCSLWWTVNNILTLWKQYVICCINYIFTDQTYAQFQILNQYRLFNTFIMFDTIISCWRLRSVRFNLHLCMAACV